MLVEPGIVQLDAARRRPRLGLWGNLDPLEAGVGDFPPALEDTTLDARLVTWLRVKAGVVAAARRACCGPASTRPPSPSAPTSRTRRCPTGPASRTRSSGSPDAGRPRRPCASIVASGDQVEAWTRSTTSPRRPRGARARPAARRRAGRDRRGRTRTSFAVDAEAGEVRFGDGVRGRRPPRGALLRADYDFGAGAAGNVGPGAIARAPALPAGIKVTNPVRTWGGADAESVAEGEKQIARYLQHRDRLVTAEDFETIARRRRASTSAASRCCPPSTRGSRPTPPGDAPGAVTLLVIPRSTALHPDAPEPDRLFLDAICRYLDPRRLVTTEVLPARARRTSPIWVSVGIETRWRPLDRRGPRGRQGGARRVPLAAGPARRGARRSAPAVLAGPRRVAPGPERHAEHGRSPCRRSRTPASGWPLAYPVRRLELDTYAGRVEGVAVVNGLLLAGEDGVLVDRVDLAGLELPRLVGVSVVVGDPAPIAQLKGAPAELGRPSGGAPGTGGVLRWTSNGTRFKVLLGEADWGRCSSGGTPLSTLWSTPSETGHGTRWDKRRSELTLAAVPWTFPEPAGQPRLRPADRRGAAVDRYGNWYWIDEGESGLRVLSSGSNLASAFWPDPTRGEPEATPTSDAFGALNTPAKAAPGALRGLAVADDHYLLVGTLRPGGLLVFDLRTGGPPLQIAWPAGVPFAPLDIAARPGGGAFVLDHGGGDGPRAWRLDRHFMVEPLRQASPVAPSPTFGPTDGSSRPAPAEPAHRLTSADAAPLPGDPVAIGLAGEVVVVLDRSQGDVGSVIRLFTTDLEELVDSPRELLGLGRALVVHDIAVAPTPSRGPGEPFGQLFVVDEQGDQAFRFPIMPTAGPLTVEPEYYPMRLFGGRGLIKTPTGAAYDVADRWVRLVSQRRSRFVDLATIDTEVFDGGEHGCVWHRVMLDGCLTPETTVRIWSAAADDPAALEDPDWRREPSPYRRGAGPERPYLAAPAGPGHGTYELLLCSTVPSTARSPERRGARPARPGRKVRPAPKANPARQARRVPQARLGPKARRGRKGCREPTAIMAIRGRKAWRVRRVRPVRQVSAGPQASPAPQARWATQASKARPVLSGRWAQRVRPAVWARPVPRAPQAHPGRPERRAARGRRARWVRPVRQAPKARKGPTASPGRKGPEAPQAPQAQTARTA